MQDFVDGIERVHLLKDCQRRAIAFLARVQELLESCVCDRETQDTVNILSVACAARARSFEI